MHTDDTALREEFAHRIETLNPAQRERFASLVVKILRCFDPNLPNEAVLLNVDGTNMEILGVNSLVPQTANIVSAAYKAMHDHYGASAEAQGYVQ